MGHDEKTDKIFHAIMTAPREKLIVLITALMEKATERKREADTARSEVARLTAEVEAMRAVVDLAEQVTPRVPSSSNFGGSFQLRRALDALRARKVGG